MALTTEMEDGITSLDVAKESVAQTLALRRPLDQTGDVGHVQKGWDFAGRLVVLHKEVEPGIGDGDSTLVGVDGAEGIIFGLDSRRRESIEDGALADVRKAHDSTSKRHRGARFALLAGNASPCPPKGKSLQEILRSRSATKR